MRIALTGLRAGARWPVPPPIRSPIRFAFRSTVRSTVALSCLLLPALLAQAQSFQSWNEVDLSASWRHVQFLMPLLARTSSSLPNPQLAATGITADLPLPRRLTLTGGYLLADLPQRSDLVHLPMIALSKSWQVGKVAIADRNRFEKLIGFGTAPVRYRNRLLLDRTLGARQQWHLFADDEVFFDLSAIAWNQNRLQAGGGARLNRRLSLDLYYLQRKPGGSAAPAYVFGSNLRVKLTP